jgi:hypothetical protein|tara:strand:- start:137 stop:469 length:333 start_codon:yes stop_codon:yes gene_type:complete
MSEENKSNEEYDPLEEIKKLRLQEQLVANAFNNSYRILNNEITFDEMLDDSFTKDLDAVLAFDPELGPALIELEGMIEFYILEEDYEKCINLRNIMHNKYPESINLDIED